MIPTEGKWLTYPQGGLTCIYTKDRQGRDVFIAQECGDIDARLMAASKPMLAALKEAERFLDYLANDRTLFVGPGTPKTALAQIRAALTEAEGLPAGGERKDLGAPTRPDREAIAEQESDETRLWLWRNGDHFLAFDSLYPTHDGGDPQTLGEPAGWAILKRTKPDRRDFDPAEIARAESLCRRFAALPAGRSKQDVANLVDLAMQDAMVEISKEDGWRYDYDILIEKLRGNGLALVAVGSAHTNAQHAYEPSSSSNPPDTGRLREAAIEECAKEAEGNSYHVVRAECHGELNGIKADIARRIRALSASPSVGRGEEKS